MNSEKMLLCLTEGVLVPSVEVSDQPKVTVVKLKAVEPVQFTLQVRMSNGTAYYLATRRNPDNPRTFRRIEAAISTAYKLFGTKTFTVMIS
jgi:hypothetical protein